MVETASKALLLTAVVAAVAWPAAAAATAPARRFNAPGQAHAHVCVRLSSARPSLRFGDGTPTGFSVTDQPTTHKRHCAPGTALLDLHEVIPSKAGPLVFRRRDYAGKAAGNVKYGELSVSDIASRLPASAPAGGGRGAPCTLAKEASYRVSVRSIPTAMRYKRPQAVAAGNGGATFMHYGDPAADQGTNHNVHFSYLLWSFLNVRGGGMVRTLLAPGQIVRPCDVTPITMNAWDSSGAVNGHVTARYVRALAGTCPLYGWMVWSHTYWPGGTAAVSHVVAMRKAPPRDPEPDPACPVSPPAAAAAH
jgi:hypothetical protein